MRKRYLIVALLSMFLFLCNVEALEFGDCEVLISFKLSSSLDENSYICKGKEYGKNTDSIYYNGKSDEVKMTAFNAYYVSVYGDVKFDVAGDNNISLLHLNNTKLNVTGNGSLKFKEGSFVKKVVAGEPVYQFVYDNKTIVNEEGKIYEGTVEEFEENYTTLALKNKLPEEFNLEEYSLVQASDYTNMISVVITDSWLEKHIDTKLSKTVLDGYGIIEYVKPKEEEKKTTETKEEDKTLKSDKVIFVSDKKVGKKYKLNVDDLQKTEVAEEVSSQLNDKSLISFYDVNVYNGKKQVEMKNGKYTIKIKIDHNMDTYENYQIIYVNDDGEIEEYLDGEIKDGYIVFKTSHLSQYGVIAKEKVIEEQVIDIKESNNNYSNVLKISILAIIVIGYLVALSILLVKGKLIKFKKLKRRTN